MKTKTKIILDAWLGRTLVFLLNICARILGKILGIDHSFDRKPNRIVICKFLGMGSIIQATPLLSTLRKNFPEAKIIFLTSKSNVKLLELIDAIDGILYIDDSSAGRIFMTTYEVLRNFWRKKPDLYIDLETYSFYSTVLATVSLARNRFGFYRIERNIRMGVYTHMMFFNSRAPIAQSYLQMARLAGCREVTDSLFRFKVNERDESSMLQKLSSLTGNSSGKYIVINPNASDLRIERRWPAKNVIHLIHRLRLAFPDKIIVLIGSANESEWVRGIHKELDEPSAKKVFNTAGRFSLNELFALIRNSELVITNDTGPMHISFALDRPTIALFGPASPSQYGQNPNAFGVYKNIYCSPCVHDFLSPPCRGDNQCMKQISVDEVFRLCEEILCNPGKEGNIQVPPMNFLKKDKHETLGIVDRSG